MGPGSRELRSLGRDDSGNASTEPENALAPVTSHMAAAAAVSAATAAAAEVAHEAAHDADRRRDGGAVIAAAVVLRSAAAAARRCLPHARRLLHDPLPLLRMDLVRLVRRQRRH